MKIEIKDELLIDYKLILNLWDSYFHNKYLINENMKNMISIY